MAAIKLYKFELYGKKSIAQSYGEPAHFEDHTDDIQRQRRRHSYGKKRGKEAYLYHTTRTRSHFFFFKNSTRRRRVLAVPVGFQCLSFSFFSFFDCFSRSRPYLVRTYPRLLTFSTSNANTTSGRND